MNHIDLLVKLLVLLVASGALYAGVRFFAKLWNDGVDDTLRPTTRRKYWTSNGRQ